MRVVSMSPWHRSRCDIMAVRWGHDPSRDFSAKHRSKYFMIKAFILEGIAGGSRCLSRKLFIVNVQRGLLKLLPCIHARNSMEHIFKALFASKRPNRPSAIMVRKPLPNSSRAVPKSTRCIQSSKVVSKCKLVNCAHGVLRTRPSAIQAIYMS